jgi:hypothetical protein
VTGILLGSAPAEDLSAVAAVSRLRRQITLTG